MIYWKASQLKWLL